MNTLANVVPYKSRPAPDRACIAALGNDLMRGDGLRVVSTWRHLPTVCGAFPKPPTKQTYEQLHTLVVEDIGRERASAGYHARSVYDPFFRLYRSYGDRWPLEALTFHLQFAGEPATIAEEVWARAVRRYEELAAMLS